MKTITKSLAAVGLSILLVGSLTNADAQGRGRGNGKGNNPGHGYSKGNPGRGHDKGHKHHDWKRDDDRHVHTWSSHFDGDRRYTYRDNRYVIRHEHVYRRPVIRYESIRHTQIRPRYVFYRDYNVYYDSSLDMFIWLSNGRWVATSYRPYVLRRVNLRTAFTVGVDYYADDLSVYVARRRPVYFSVRAIL